MKQVKLKRIETSVIKLLDQPAIGYIELCLLNGLPGDLGSG